MFYHQLFCLSLVYRKLSRLFREIVRIYSIGQFSHSFSSALFLYLPPHLHTDRWVCAICVYTGGANIKIEKKKYIKKSATITWVNTAEHAHTHATSTRTLAVIGFRPNIYSRVSWVTMTTTSNNNFGKSTQFVRNVSYAGQRFCIEFSLTKKKWKKKFNL